MALTFFFFWWLVSISNQIKLQLDATDLFGISVSKMTTFYCINFQLSNVELTYLEWALEQRREYCFSRMPGFDSSGG